MEASRNEFVPDTEPNINRGPGDRDEFLLEEGLELLACYRAIGDPHVRLLVRHLVARLAKCQTREQ